MITPGTKKGATLMEMEKKKRELHHHLIIQKITSAPADCYSVWAWWEDESKREAKVEFRRVPCFAVVSHCAKSYEDQYDSECAPMLEEQTIQPCVEAEDSRSYYPIKDWYVNDCENYRCIGIHYESSKEPPIDWQALALAEYDREMARKARKAKVA